MVEIAKWRLGEEQAATFARFAQHYFARVPGEDIYRISPDNLFGAAYAHWRLAEKRPTDRALVRVYNPRLDEDGWRSDHSVVEIVTDDMPFLVDSVTAELGRRDIAVQLVIHPVIRVRRGDKGELIGLADDNAGESGEEGDAAGGTAMAESFMHFEIVRQPDAAVVEIAEALARVLADVRRAVEDWQAMRDTLKVVLTELETPPPCVAADEVAEGRDFLNWLDNNFTFLGYRAYNFVAASGVEKQPIAFVVASSGLGLLREADILVFDEFR
ncbi:MAG: hypothetical protein ACXW2K_16380, partial [Allosphingosinicella sp.]